jgi:hypothetical protein
MFMGGVGRPAQLCLYEVGKPKVKNFFEDLKAGSLP